MKGQILFSRKNKKNISKFHLLKFLPSIQSVKNRDKIKLLKQTTVSKKVADYNDIKMFNHRDLKMANMFFFIFK